MSFEEAITCNVGSTFNGREVLVFHFNRCKLLEGVASKKLRRVGSVLGFDNEMSFEEAITRDVGSTFNGSGCLSCCF